jgi:hypothetical protein
MLIVALPEPMMTESVIEDSQPIIPTTIAPTAAPNNAIVPSVCELIDHGETVPLQPSIASLLDPPLLLLVLQQSPLTRARIMPRANPELLPFMASIGLRHIKLTLPQWQCSFSPVEC